MKKKTSIVKQETIREKYDRIGADLQEEHDKEFPPIPLSVEDIDYELYIDSLNNTPNPKVKNIVNKTSESRLHDMTAKRIDDLHKLHFSNTKTSSAEELTLKMKAAILLKPIKKGK
ncbi:MAG: hypothetical protein EOP47_05140 [Sphingobacteriaceae bacterium]|nr:MAG: hypothetical protein EOP47_05140 [Sphingobacteriaceae bacterium]